MFFQKIILSTLHCIVHVTHSWVERFNLKLIHWYVMIQSSGDDDLHEDDVYEGPQSVEEFLDSFDLDPSHAHEKMVFAD